MYFLFLTLICILLLEYAVTLSTIVLLGSALLTELLNLRVILGLSELPSSYSFSLQFWGGQQEGLINKEGTLLSKGRSKQD